MVKKEVVFRPASLQERKEFYEKEFSIEKVKKWFSSNGMKLPQLCAIDAGSETGIIINKKYKNQMLYFHFYELLEKIKKYVPEDVYYSRNYYDNPAKILRMMKLSPWKTQELVFDIDIDNLSSEGIVNNRVIRKAFHWALKMKHELENEFERVELVYSGRGFHLHVLVKKAFLLSKEERMKIVKRFSKFPIDPWVSLGNIDLIRMPYSLHGVVSRVVLPIKNAKFEEKKSYPRFLFH